MERGALRIQPEQRQLLYSSALRESQWITLSEQQFEGGAWTDKYGIGISKQGLRNNLHLQGLVSKELIVVVWGCR